jgi:hypothetical protein
MDPALIKLLWLLSLFCMPGLFFLWAVKASSSRFELFFMGCMLIFWSAFSLVLISVAIGALEPVLDDKDSSEYMINQVKSFLPFLFFFAPIYTFLFGGVGTNAVSSALMDKNHISIDKEHLRKIENKLDKVSEDIGSFKNTRWTYIIPSLIISVLCITLSVWLFK